MPSLPDDLRLGPVALTVTDLDRSVGFYQDALGLRVHRREDGGAALGAGAEDLLELTEDPAARPAGRHAGLYHLALLYPGRRELARALARLALSRTPIRGLSDHGTHEAIYLPDPDGIGIELAADRPREAWPGGGRYVAGPAPLDTDDLLGTVAGEEPGRHAAPGIVVGHLHLHVGDVEAALGFYRDLVGFELMTAMPTAAFVSAGGYHHHLAFNTWRGEGVPAPPPGTLGLRHWTVILPSRDEVEAVRDRLAAAGVATEPAGEGFAVRDPWSLEIRFRG